MTLNSPNLPSQRKTKPIMGMIRVVSIPIIPIETCVQMVRMLWGISSL